MPVRAASPYNIRIIAVLFRPYLIELLQNFFKNLLFANCPLRPYLFRNLLVADSESVHKRREFLRFVFSEVVASIVGILFGNSDNVVFLMNIVGVAGPVMPSSWAELGREGINGFILALEW